MNKGGLVLTLREGDGIEFTVNGERFEVWIHKKDGHLKMLVNADKELVKVGRLKERVKRESTRIASV